MHDHDYISAARAALQQLAAADAGLFRASLPQADLVRSGQRVFDRLDKDMAGIGHDSDILFSTHASAKTGHALARLFTRWRENPPSTTALILVAAKRAGTPPDSKNLQAALMAGIAADVALANPYHNNNHFREVTAMMARYCVINNTLTAGGDAQAIMLTPDDIALCLAAAAGHDLLHNGKGNAPNGPESHTQYLLERQSIAALQPFLTLAGVSAADCEHLGVMILTTDVTSKPGGTPPHKILRQVIDGTAANVPLELAPLLHDKKLRVMAALMSDSDLSPSAGLSYLFSKEQARTLHDELPFVLPTDKSTLDFLSFVVEKKFISRAAQAVTQSGLDDILAKATNRNDAPVNAGLEHRPSSPKPPAA